MVENLFEILPLTFGTCAGPADDVVVIEIHVLQGNIPHEGAVQEQLCRAPSISIQPTLYPSS
jgi:hypothetical protein